MKLSEICLVNTWSERFNLKGQLSLLHVNDTIHVIEYKDQERSIAVDVDHVELRDEDSTARFTFPRGSNDRLIFKIDDIAEFSVLCKAKEDCQAVCDLKLRLNSMLRDSYYSGVYSNLDPDAKLVLCDEVDRMKKENPGMFFSSLLNSNEVRIDTANLSSAKPAKGGDSASVALVDVACVFCDTKKYNTDVEFLVHPHVPKNSSGKNIYMCAVCLENWKEFREIAEHEDQLILPGEVNEEICAICSDTPSTLVLCGDCQRSFCNTCLQRIITPKEQNELISNPDADWMCVCCIAGYSKHPPLGRTAWKVVVPCPGKRGLYYGTLVPYVKSAQLSSNGSSGDAAKLKNALAEGITIDAAVAQSIPLLASLAGKKTASRSSSAQDFSQFADEGEDDISEDTSLPPRAAYRRTHAEETHRNATAGPSMQTPKGGPSRGRGKTKASYAVEDVDFAVTLQAQNKSAYSSNNRGNRMQKRQQGQGKAAGVKSGPVLDERYYFGQYVGYYSLLCEEIAQRAPASGKGGRGGGAPVKRKRPQDEIPTDDVCFLCKDGGDLIECDWKCPAAKDGERCLKVYHTYCLDFEVSDEKWCCPRHFCDMCGSQTLKYICKYCPVSICANCPENLVAKYGHARYCAVNDPVAGNWRHQPTAPGLQSIVCQSCTEMLEAINLAASSSGTSSAAGSDAAAGSLVSAKGSAPLELVRSELRDEKRFPGKFSGEGKPGTSSIYLKEAPGSSSDDRTSTTDAIVVAKAKPQSVSRGSSSVVTTHAIAPRPAPASRRSRAPVLTEEKVVAEKEVEPVEATVPEEKEEEPADQEEQTVAEPGVVKSSDAQEAVDTEMNDDEVEAPPATATEISQGANKEEDAAPEESMKPPALPRSHKRGASKSSTRSVASSPPASPKSTTSAVSSQSRTKPASTKPKYSELDRLGITTSAQSSPRADSFSPLKKRAASSLAQFNISMQLKGDVKPAAAENPKARSGSTSPPHKRTAAFAPREAPAASAKKASASKPADEAEDSSDEEGELVTIPQRITRSREQDAQLSTRSGKKLLSGSDLLPGLM